jgi:hypothetical protein
MVDAESAEAAERIGYDTEAAAWDHDTWSAIDVQAMDDQDRQDPTAGAATPPGGLRMEKHTPGPWRQVVPPSACFTDRFIVAENEATVAEVGGRYSHLDSDIFQVVANARLIATAPEMLALLRLIHARLEVEEAEHPGGIYLLAACREDIGAVIRQAEGK